jgi:hypothetical protein
MLHQHPCTFLPCGGAVPSSEGDTSKQSSLRNGFRHRVSARALRSFVRRIQPCLRCLLGFEERAEETKGGRNLGCSGASKA